MENWKENGKKQQLTWFFQQPYDKTYVFPAGRVSTTEGSLAPSCPRLSGVPGSQGRGWERAATPPIRSQGRTTRGSSWWKRLCLFSVNPPRNPSTFPAPHTTYGARSSQTETEKGNRKADSAPLPSACPSVRPGLEERNKLRLDTGVDFPISLDCNFFVSGKLWNPH